MRNFKWAWLGAGLLLAVSAAEAGPYSNGVAAAFKGTIVVSKDEVPVGKTDKETIAKLKGASLSALVGEKAADVMQWHFHYAGFLSKTGATSLKMEFVTADKDQRLAADKQL